MSRVESTISKLGFNPYNRRDSAVIPSPPGMMETLNMFNRAETPDTREEIPLSTINQLLPDKAINLEKTTIDTFTVNQFIRGGATGYNAGTGWWIGLDGSTPKLFIGDSSGDKVTWDGTTLSISGSLIAGNIHIPDKDTTANSFHVDGNGNSWWGCTDSDFTSDNENAKAYVLKTGFAVFQDVRSRGMMSGSTFKYNEVSAVGGQMMIANADVLNVAMTALDASTLTTSGATTFAVNDLLLIRADNGSGIQEEWLRVTNIASAPTYTVTRDLAAAHVADTNPAWKKGMTVTKQGTSDGAAAYSGGWLRLLGEGTNSPHYSVFTKDGVCMMTI